MKEKDILIINTGGTISSVPAKHGLVPQSGYVETMFSTLKTLHHPTLPHFHIKEYKPLIDSSNITLDHWNKLAQDIADHDQRMDGFIILHGTDTMAYTASALSFMLKNLGKPVILTGAQLALSDARNDASSNIITSLLLCTHYPIYEVCVYFSQKILRGNRARKLHANRFDAFDSPNFPPLGTIGIDITLNEALLLPQPTEALQPSFLSPQPIADFRLFPGYDLHALEQLIDTPIKALILETYGAGNAPNQDPKFFNILKKANDQHILIINTSQCLTGHVDTQQYPTGRSLEQLGVLSGHNMTPEALHAKLLYAFSQTEDVQKVRAIISRNLCGEMD